MRIFQPLIVLFSISLLIVTAFAAGPVSHDTNPRDYQIAGASQAETNSPGEALNAHEDFFAFTAPMLELLLLDEEEI